MKRIGRAWKRDTGQVLIIFVLALPVLLGMSALVVDLGNLFVQKRNLQKAADASALAATQALPPSPDQPAPDPAVGCSVPSQCDTNVAKFASDFSSGNGAPAPLPRCDTSANITTNCYDLIDILENVCPATGPTSTTCVPVRVQVTLSKTVTTLFGGIIGKRDWVVRATARALKTDAVSIVPGTVTTYEGVTYTTPDIVTTTPDIVVTTDGTVSTIPGTVTTIPGTVTTTPATVTTGPDVVVTTQLPGGPALLEAKSTSCTDPVPLKIGGANSEFKGGVISNGGVLVLSNDIKGDEMLWGHGTNPSCVDTKPADWGGSISEASHIFDWIVPLPICEPAAACQPGSTTIATFINDDKGRRRACTPFSDFSASNPQPGLYCSTTKIVLPNNKALISPPGFGFVAPSIDLGGGNIHQYRGYDQLSIDYGGFFVYAYNGDVKSAGTDTGFRGAIFAPLGEVSLSGSASSAVCVEFGPKVGGCGFIEALTITLTGAKAVWQGIGPGVEGGSVTTTTPGTVTTIPATTTTTPATVTTTPATVTTTGGVVTTTPGTVTTTPGGVITSPPTVTTTPPSTVTTPGRTSEPG